jgi:hypothetical protein
MFSEKFRAYLKAGLIAGIITSIIATVTFLLSSFFLGFTLEFIGENRDTLYGAVVFFVSLLTVFLGSLLFYLLQKFTHRPTRYFFIIVVIAFIGNTFMAETSLLEQYKIAAHIVHVIVAGLAIYLVPKLTRRPDKKKS